MAIASQMAVSVLIPAALASSDLAMQHALWFPSTTTGAPPQMGMRNPISRDENEIAAEMADE